MSETKKVYAEIIENRNLNKDDRVESIDYTGKCEELEIEFTTGTHTAAYDALKSDIITKLAESISEPCEIIIKSPLFTDKIQYGDV